MALTVYKVVIEGVGSFYAYYDPEGPGAPWVTAADLEKDYGWDEKTIEKYFKQRGIPTQVTGEIQIVILSTVVRFTVLVSGNSAFGKYGKSFLLPKYLRGAVADIVKAAASC